MKYAVVIEKTQSGFFAHVPDLHGCIANGDTLEDASDEIRQAIETYLEGLQMDGQAIPEPNSKVGYIEVTTET